MLALDHKRQFKDFDLYTEARHRVYAEMYEKLRDVESTLRGEWRTDRPHEGLVEELHQYKLRHELYLSPAVRKKVVAALRGLWSLREDHLRYRASGEHEDDLWRQTRDGARSKIERVFKEMQRELTRGDYPVATVVETPKPH